MPDPKKSEKPADSSRVPPETETPAGDIAPPPVTLPTTIKDPVEREKEQERKQ